MLPKFIPANTNVVSDEIRFVTQNVKWRKVSNKDGIVTDIFKDAREQFYKAF